MGWETTSFQTMEIVFFNAEATVIKWSCSLSHLMHMPALPKLHWTLSVVKLVKKINKWNATLTWVCRVCLLHF